MYKLSIQYPGKARTFLKCFSKGEARARAAMVLKTGGSVRILSIPEAR